MIVEPVTMDAALYIANNMRERDKEEIYACRWRDDPLEVAHDIVAAGSFAWVAGVEKPIAAIGGIPLRPGVWSMFMLATDEFPKIRFSLTKFARFVILQTLINIRAHRAEAYSLDKHTEAHRWLEAFGAKRESVAKGYGRNGEDFYCYVWRPDNVPGKDT